MTRLRNVVKKVKSAEEFIKGMNWYRREHAHVIVYVSVRISNRKSNIGKTSIRRASNSWSYVV